VPASRLVNRNVIAERGRTSMRLEPEFWSALAEICQRERVRIGALIRRIELESGVAGQEDGGRTSAVRVFVLQYFRNPAATDCVPPQSAGWTGAPAGAQGTISPNAPSA